MDQITHAVRRNHWAAIITAVNNRPAGTSVKQWLRDNEIKEKAYYYWLRKFRKEAYESLEHTETKNAITQRDVSFTELSLKPEGYSYGIPMTFEANAIVRYGDHTIAFSNTANESLIRSVMEVIVHAC